MSNQENTEESTRAPEITVEEIIEIIEIEPKRSDSQSAPSPAVPVSDDK